AVVDENGAGAAPAAAPSSGNGSSAKSATPPAPAPTPAPAPAPAPVPVSAPAEEPRATPTAKRMAKDHEVDLGGVQGTGTAGRVTKQDVKNVIAKPLAPVKTGDRTEERVRMTKRRQTIARRLVEAQ